MLSQPLAVDGMLTVVTPCVVKLPVPLRELLPVTSKVPLTVTVPGPPKAPPLMASAPAIRVLLPLMLNQPLLMASAVPLVARSSETLTLTPAPEMASVPVPVMLAPVLRLRVLPEKFSVVPASSAYQPVSVPGPPMVSMPALTLTVPVPATSTLALSKEPVLLKLMLALMVCAPAAVWFSVPRLFTTAVPV